MPQFYLSFMLALITAVSLGVGYTAICHRYEVHASKQYDLTSSYITKAFAEIPLGLNMGEATWESQSDIDFDRTFYDVWLSEVLAKPRLQGLHQIGYCNAPIVESNELRKEQARIVQNHFINPLESIGYVIANYDVYHLSGHGYQNLLTLVHPEVETEVDLQFIYGREGFTFVAINFGEELSDKANEISIE